MKQSNFWQQTAALCLLMLATGAEATQPRVIALGGDVTDIVYALNAQEQLVAVDSTSVWPSAAQKLPNVGYVRQLSTEGILALKPTHVLATQDAGPPTVIEQLKQFGLVITHLPLAREANDILHKVALIGQALNTPESANRLHKRLEQQANLLKEKVDAMSYHPRVVFVMNAGTSGLMVAGKNTAAEAAVVLAGGNFIVTDYSGYKPLSSEALIQLKPDVLLLMQTTGNGEIDELANMPAVKHTPAGKQKRIFLVEGEALLGFGARTLEKALQLQSQLADTTKP